MSKLKADASPPRPANVVWYAVILGRASLRLHLLIRRQEAQANEHKRSPKAAHDALYQFVLH